MSLVTHIMNYQELYDAIQATGTWDTVAEAVEAGAVYIEKGQPINGLHYIRGGNGTPVTELGKTALETAKNPSILSSAWSMGTAAVAAALKNGKIALVGLATIDVPTAVAAVSPLAGVAIGEELWRANPSLWNKISRAVIPYCYEENKIRAYIDYLIDPETGIPNPVMLLSRGIYEALKSLFDNEVIPKSEYEVEYSGDEVSYNGAIFPAPHEYKGVSYGDGATFFAWVDRYQGVSFSRTYYPGSEYNSEYRFYSKRHGSPIDLEDQILYVNPVNNLSKAIDLILGSVEPGAREYPAGVSAPSAPVAPPETWPFPPIVIPDPLGPDYQPLPTIPVAPPMLPEPEPIPALPEHVPDPTPEKPEEWPEEEPWPSTVPFPFPNPDPSTEPGPDPDWPEIIPWPLPSEPPEEWPDEPPENWPKYPPSWPEEFPEELPWPTKPDEWPLEVPWPENPPEWWPDGTPWPTQPDEWPETVPWPMPPSWPVPWPPYYPYPWPYPYPMPSPDPYPDPEKLDDPETQIDPYIDPWPYPWPYPWPSPKPETDIDPTRDPTQPEPEPLPDPETDPSPKPEPVNPTPTPPEGEIDPPVPPIVPLPFSSTTGLISVYHPSQSQLLAFANWLWVTWQDATIDKIWNNPFDGVITLFELYCTPTDVGTKNIRSGFLDSGVNSPIISRYTEIDCGSIGVPEYFGNYLDYAPYSKCHMYLPFIGIVELNVDDIVGHGVNVTYKIDEYNGSCIAMITVAKSTDVNGVSVDYSNIMYQFSGNCAVELPLSGGSQAAIKAGMLEAAAWGIGSVIGGIMSGNALGDIGANLAYGVASAVHSVVSAKSSVQHSGSFGASYGAMGCKKPFIIVTRPKQIQVPNYNEHYGYQAHKMVRVGDCTGYLRCREVHVISPTASDEEKAQIEQLMKTGVYVTE